MQKNLFKKPTRRDLLREEREERERRFGSRLDHLDGDELLRICESIFPGWPRPFGRRRFHLESARQDVVLRRLLLCVLEKMEAAP